eukprot:TRINITY_DN6704_c0_g1_i4.p1 TRINITY_DN6704_c0_g1~~TRINITY_DN6704_c0_g1_i4.p1  ORF type:complete len:502 (+),score=93.54 TRINITY_DN6704_c0_g1_i4:98-1603(+)
MAWKVAVAACGLLVAPRSCFAVRVGESDGTGAKLDASLALTMHHEAAPGRHLLDRYVLKEFITSDVAGRTPDNPLGHSLAEMSEATPGGIPTKQAPNMAYPGSPDKQWIGMQWLANGSFGDTWQAHDTKLGKSVALKIFYDGHSPGGPSYVDWLSASGRIKDDLKDNAKECTLQQWLVAQRGLYEKGAAHICQCYGEHVMDQQGSNRPCFLVLEMCGGSMDKEIHGAPGRKPLLVRYWGRKLVKQLLEGLRFLNRVNFIHHDLKPANIVVNLKTGYLKLIDFGATVRSTTAWQWADFLPSTPPYTPPEADPVTPGKQRFSTAQNGLGSSFDIFAAGMIWLEAICPDVNAGHWYANQDGPTTRYGAGRRAMQAAISLCPDLETHNYDDLRQIESMIHDDPNRRPRASQVLEAAPLNAVKDVPAPADFPDSPPPPSSFSPAMGPSGPEPAAPAPMRVPVQARPPVQFRPPQLAGPQLQMPQMPPVRMPQNKFVFVKQPQGWGS